MQITSEKPATTSTAIIPLPRHPACKVREAAAADPFSSSGIPFSKARNTEFETRTRSSGSLTMAYHLPGLFSQAERSHEHHAYRTADRDQTAAFPAAGRAMRHSVRLRGGHGGTAPYQTPSLRNGRLGGCPR